MTVGSVNGGASPFLSLASESISDGTFTSVGGELAVLMLDSQERQKELDRQQLASARLDFSEALADEVDALREQADASFRGAVFSGSLALASGGFGTWAVARDCKDPWQKPVGEGLGKLSEPLGAVVGSNYGAADATAAAGKQEGAKWQLDDSRDALADAARLQDKALDWASSIAERDAATTTAILSNKA